MAACFGNDCHRPASMRRTWKKTPVLSGRDLPNATKAIPSVFQDSPGWKIGVPNHGQTKVRARNASLTFTALKRRQRTLNVKGAPLLSVSRGTIGNGFCASPAGNRPARGPRARCCMTRCCMHPSLLLRVMSAMGLSTLHKCLPTLLINRVEHVPRMIPIPLIQCDSGLWVNSLSAAWTLC